MLDGLLGSNLATTAQSNDLVKENVLERKEEGSSQNALGDLGANALVEAGVALVLDDAVEGLGHALLLARAAGNVHLALDGDVGVRHRGGKELAEGAQEEGDGGRHLAPRLDGILHLLKERVLKNGVDDQHQRRQDTGEEGLGALLLEESHERGNGRGTTGLALVASLEVRLVVVLVGGHASVDDPDGVRHDDGGRAGNGAGNHGLDRGELLAGAAGLDGGGLEEGARPLVPVVVDKVGDADAEQGRVEARVEAGDALARNDLLDSVAELAIGLFGFDLGSGRQGNKRVSVWAGLGQYGSNCARAS